VRDHISGPYETTGKIVFLSLIIFGFSMADGNTKVRSEVLMEVNIKITVTWDVTPCSLVDKYQPTSHDIPGDRNFPEDEVSQLTCNKHSAKLFSS
jgi:hypothetical protein